MIETDIVLKKWLEATCPRLKPFVAPARQPEASPRRSRIYAGAPFSCANTMHTRMEA
jgi:hypothetical protein